MDLYLIGLKLYLINRACGGIPLSLATHVATTYAMSATWWTTKKTVGLIGYGAVGTYKLITHVARASSQPRDPIDAITENWEPINPTEYEPNMDWELLETDSVSVSVSDSVSVSEKIVFLNDNGENIRNSPNTSKDN